MAKVSRMTDDEILKLKAVVLYIFEKCKEIDYFHLFKILYFADREHYAHYGRRMTNDTFCALKNGPVPSNLYNAVKDAIGVEPLSKRSPLKIISKSLCSNDDTYSYILSAKELPDMDELSQSDIEMLDKSISENKDTSFKDLSEKSHDLAWHAAHDKEPTSEISPLMMAKAGGASDDTISFIEQNEALNKILSDANFN